jgi:hypothetical protein
MSRRVLKKDPGLPSQIWDAYYPPSTLGTLFWSAAGGEARTGCRPSSSLKQKIDDFISCPAMAAALRGGATAMMAARGGRSGLKTDGGSIERGGDDKDGSARDGSARDGSARDGSARDGELVDSRG